jgi:hypothetical protein
MDFNFNANIVNPDGFYDELLAVHQDLTKEQSDAFNARLILVPANHMGDRDLLRSALVAAK